MKRKLAALLAVLVLTLASFGAATVPALADEPQPIKIDLGAAENGDYDGYRVDDNAITLLNAGAIYELSGETNRQVIAANASIAEDSEEDPYFYLLLNGATVRGGIAPEDQDNSYLAINVPEDTTSNVETIDALVLSVNGGGTLYAESINVGATKTDAPAAERSYLFVKDAQIEVRRSESATKSCVWMGAAELSGNASVTYVSAGDYASLMVYNAGGFDEAVTIMDEARLYCLHANADEPSNTYVDGLHLQGGKLLLQDSAFLQAEARPLADALEGVGEAQGGCAVFCGDDIEVRDNAQIRADAYGWAVNTGTNMSVSGKGAYVWANSKNSQGIYLEGALSVSDGARVDAVGKLEGVSLGTLSVDNATLTSESETLNAVRSVGNININGSVVATTSAPGFAAFSAEGKIVIEGSLVVAEKGTGLEADADADVIDSIVFVGSEGMVVGNATLLDDLSIDSGETLTISAGDSLTIPADKHLHIAEGGTLVIKRDGVLVNNGTIHVLGAIDNEGSIECNNHSGGKANCASGALCDLCHEEYTDPDPTNHASLKHVKAKAATTTAEGNIEYWICNGCGKYFADAAAEKEITQASTVLAKLREQKPADKKGSANNTKAPTKKLPQTGDEASVLPVAMVLAGGVAFASAALVAKRS